MLTVKISGDDLFDEEQQKFFSTEAESLTLEHSLVSVSKWESIWNLPFLSHTQKTNEQTFSYIECMISSGGISPETVRKLPVVVLNEIGEYINAPMTATFVKEREERQRQQETITSELVYYWMISLNIPFECQHWHLNRLLTLIKVCNFKNAPKKKMAKAEAARERQALNAQRRAKLGTTG